MLLKVDKDELLLLRGALEILNENAVRNKKSTVASGEMSALEYDVILGKSFMLESKLTTAIAKEAVREMDKVA